MSRHAIDRAGWTPEERHEYEALLAEIVAATRDSGERLDLFEHRLVDAVQAQRPWASEVDRMCRRFGLAKEVSRFQARNRALVAYDGEVLSLPAVQARKVAKPGGEVGYQRELIEVWSWEELTAKRDEALAARRTYDGKVAHYDRLLALRALAPSAATPAEAARMAGVDLGDWLSRAA
ncbi:hypothetical protein CSH63_17710 [Micromonospora tulbaghiae]|uniref:Uncharacterized protein n=1 Tax=Micromonospora tulbaghiae TaxID=479978 RepID=A0A386WNN0_9ACTN|nr:hypothetical protein [Micromonospora tulbaghiae]AYF29268.1 hypothetical protein CSH63_17710 [Micromonospora tulbaghiae]